ncbi:MAG: hypothetical protein J7L23_04990 [Candidatus Diapherotrites archaeon]|nr:hypothetical protein [Candidatus Diapherotrites archaeon]
MEIYKADVVSITKMLAILGLVFGFLVGILVFFLNIVTAISSGADLVNSFVWGIVLWIAYFFGTTIGMALVGAIGTIVFNLVAEKIGGINIELR